MRKSEKCLVALVIMGPCSLRSYSGSVSIVASVDQHVLPNNLSERQFCSYKWRG